MQLRMGKRHREGVVLTSIYIWLIVQLVPVHILCTEVWTGTNVLTSNPTILDPTRSNPTIMCDPKSRTIIPTPFCTTDCATQIDRRAKRWTSATRISVKSVTEQYNSVPTGQRAAMLCGVEGWAWRKVMAAYCRVYGVGHVFTVQLYQMFYCYFIHLSFLYHVVFFF